MLTETDSGATTQLEMLHQASGRALLLEKDGTLFLSRGYRIFKTTDGVSFQPLARLPSGWKRRWAPVSRLTSRALRYEVRALNQLSDGSLVASNREWVFYGRPEDPYLQRSQVDATAQALAPPMSLTVGPRDRILWGEYNSHNPRKPVRLYVSDDRGRSYQVARTFERGVMLHVHNLVYDPAIGKYWFLSGDHEDEPGIALLSADLKDFDWVAKGKQIYRAVEVFDFGDRLIYGMDSEKEPNAIVSFDKKSGRVERLVEIEGSCIYSCRFGGWYVLTTTVEPSAINHCRYATMWVSRDGENWRRTLCAEKDRWDARLFQYGSLVLPRGASDRETIFFSGQALVGYDGRLFAARLHA